MTETQRKWPDFVSQRDIIAQHEAAVSMLMEEIKRLEAEVERMKCCGICCRASDPGADDRIKEWKAKHKCGRKNGKAKHGKTYTVYTIFDENGEKYRTFDTNDTGSIVAIKYVVGKFGNKITGMELSQEQAA